MIQYLSFNNILLADICDIFFVHFIFLLYFLFIILTSNLFWVPRGYLEKMSLFGPAVPTEIESMHNRYRQDKYVYINLDYPAPPRGFEK